MNERCSRAKRGAWARGIGVALLVLGLLGPAPARAQRLDFDAAGVFKPDTEKSLAADIDHLRRDITERTPKATSPTTRAQVRVRELAAALLEFGAKTGDEATPHVLKGRRILSRLADLDAELARAASGSSGEARLEKFLASCPADPAVIPADSADLDRVLAELFAPLAPTANPKQPERRAWAIEGIDPALATPEAMEAAIADLRSAGAGLITDPPRAATLSAADRQLVVQAARGVTAPVKWLSIDARQKLGAIVGDALARLARPESARTARADLTRVATLADALQRIDGARLTARQTRVMRTLGESMAKTLEAGASDCDDALSALRRGLRMINELDSLRWKESTRLVREVRPLWKEVEQDARRTREETLESIGRLTPTSPALSDPGVLASFAALARVRDDARAVCVISAWMAGSTEPGAAASALLDQAPGAADSEGVTLKGDKVRRMAGVRLLTLVPKARKESSREEALGAVRTLARGLEEWFPLPGEALMRSGAGPWQGVTGNGAADLLAAADTERAAWLNEWSTGKEAAEQSNEAATTSGHLGMLRELAAMSRSVLAVESLMEGPGAQGIRAWPGYALSGKADSITAPLRAEIGRLCGMVRTADYDELTKALVHVRGHAKIVSTLEKLDAGARAQGVTLTPMLAELAEAPATRQGPSDRVAPGVWLGESRENVASLCRALEEHGAATRAGERERWTALQRFMVAECDQILRALAERR